MSLIPEELNRYLDFLEKSKFIKSKEEAVKVALNFYKKFGMHAWLPHIYTICGLRVVLVQVSMLSEIFQALSDDELYTVGRKFGLRRKDEDRFLSEIDTRLVENWVIVLRDLEVLGWGKFSLIGEEIKIEFCALPIPFLLGYFEAMLGVPFRQYKTKISNLVILIPVWKPKE
jgi:hypothetical protein